LRVEMTDINPPEERGTAYTDNDPDRTTRRLVELSRIADTEFQKQRLLRQFGREIMVALKADEGIELTRHQQLLDELFDPPNRPGWRFYIQPAFYQEP
jgi:hypothetical protein